MRRFLKILFIFIIFLNFNAIANSGSDFYDLDFKFIDNPFAGQKIITDKEYEKAYSTYKQNNETKRTKGFWNWVFKHTLPKEKQYQPPSDTPKSQMSDEMKFQKDILNTKPVVTITSKISDDEGKIIERGYYQVYFENSLIKLKQGHDIKGTFKARAIQDNWNEDKVIYARVVNENKGFIKIIYSDLKGCWEAYATVEDNY